MIFRSVCGRHALLYHWTTERAGFISFISVSAVESLPTQIKVTQCFYSCCLWHIHHDWDDSKQNVIQSESDRWLALSRQQRQMFTYAMLTPQHLYCGYTVRGAGDDPVVTELKVQPGPTGLSLDGGEQKCWLTREFKPRSSQL